MWADAERSDSMNVPGSVGGGSYARDTADQHPGYQQHWPDDSILQGRHNNENSLSASRPSVLCSCGQPAVQYVVSVKLHVTPMLWPCLSVDAVGEQLINQDQTKDENSSVARIAVVTFSCGQIQSKSTHWAQLAHLVGVIVRTQMPAALPLNSQFNNYDSQWLGRNIEIQDLLMLMVQ